MSLTIRLSAEAAAAIDEMVADGEFANRTEAVRHALGLLVKREAEVQE